MNTQDVIDSVMKKAKVDLQAYIDGCNSQKKPLCDLRIDWKNPHYEKNELQHLYMLRYFYAYLLEFRWLFDFIKLDRFNIFSIGCGAYVDLLGLFTSNNSSNKSVVYCGIDPVDWEYRDFIRTILPENYEINFQSQKFEDYVEMPDGKNILGRANVIVFPKSIEYMDTSVWTKIVEETDFQENIIYLVMNAMDFEYKNDNDKIDLLARLIMGKGFVKKFAIEKDWRIPRYCLQFSGSPKYPQDIFDSWIPRLFEQCCLSNDCKKKNSCYLCNFKFPMIKTDTFNYKIYRLEKNDSQC